MIISCVPDTKQRGISYFTFHTLLVLNYAAKILFSEEKIKFDNGNTNYKTHVNSLLYLFLFT